MPSALVVGGGLAGCAAAVRLAEAGWRVTLLERHPRLGGRVSSFRWGGGWVDNGQHVATKACTAFRAFLEAVGAADRMRWQTRLRIPFVSPGGRLTVLTRWDLPAPAHLLPGLMAFDLLSPVERWGLRRALQACRGEAPEAADFRSWLAGLGQGEASLGRFWDPLVLAVCNAPCAAVSARRGAWVVREALCTRADALDLGIAAVPQARLFADGVARRVAAAGGSVRTGAAVEEVLAGGGRAPGARLRGGETLAADGVVLAVPWEAAAALLPGRLGEPALLPGAILSVTLRLDRPVLPDEAVDGFAALVDSPVHWAFSKTRCWGLDPAAGELLSLVLSGANALMTGSGAELVALALGSLRAALPRMASARVLDAVAMREKRATFLPAPGAEALRPSTRAAGLEGLALAGAWTATPWPATMEGAVLSGNAAAEALVSGRA